MDKSMETLWRNEQVPVLVLYNLRIFVQWWLGLTESTLNAIGEGGSNDFSCLLTILSAVCSVLDLFPPSSTEARVLHDLFLGYATESLDHL